MIDIASALYNVLHSRYGRDVRTSIHDAIYQINENANEALQNAKTMGVGTDISSPTSPSTGYVEGNLYLNSDTWEIWQCVGTNSWLNKGSIQGAKGDAGADGKNNYIFIRFSQYYDGTDFTATPTASSQFLGVYYGTSETAPTDKRDYQWTQYVGASGTSAYVHIMYSEYADGTNFVNAPTPLTKYIGFYAGSSSSAPANKSYYTWSEYVGKSGTGTGDMLKADYDTDNNGAVDKADRVGTADTAVLEKFSDTGSGLLYNGKPIGGKVDIDEKTIVKNALEKLEVPIDTDTLEYDSSSKKVKVADSLTAKIDNMITEVKANGTAQTVADGSVNIVSATTGVYGVTKLNDSVTSTSKVLAATANSVKTVNDKVDSTFGTSTVGSDGKTVSFKNINTSKCYKLFVDMGTSFSNKKPIGIESETLNGTTLTFVLTNASAGMSCKLKEIKL